MAAGPASSSNRNLLDEFFGPLPAIQVTGWIAVLAGMIVGGCLLLRGSGQRLAWAVGLAAPTLGMFKMCAGAGLGYVPACVRAAVEILAGALQIYNIPSPLRQDRKV